jgi:hypothetical protein
MVLPANVISGGVQTLSVVDVAKWLANEHHVCRVFKNNFNCGEDQLPAVDRVELLEQMSKKQIVHH